MEGVFLLALLLIGWFFGDLQYGILCPYNIRMYKDTWNYNKKTTHTRDEFDIMIDSKATYYWMNRIVVWKKNGKKVLFPATCIGSNTIVGRSCGFISANAAEQFINEFYTHQSETTTEYNGVTIYKLFKSDANSHPSISYGDVFYISFINGNRIYDIDINIVKNKIQTLKNK